jgi:hypothetical protein
MVRRGSAEPSAQGERGRFDFNSIMDGAASGQRVTHVTDDAISGVLGIIDNGAYLNTSYRDHGPYTPEIRASVTCVTHTRANDFEQISNGPPGRARRRQKARDFAACSRARKSRSGGAQ